MRVISKKISYNDLISRLPGVIPSIMDSWEITQLGKCINNDAAEKYYSYSQAVKRASEYNINPSELRYSAEFVYFNKDNLREFSVGNYGLIVSDVIIPQSIANKITDYTDFYVNIPDDNGGFYDLSWPKNSSDPHYEGRKIISGGTEVKILTYHTLNKWYTFFKKYYELLSNPSFKRTYSSAIEYYKYEINGKNQDVLKEYEYFDKLYESRGGKDTYDWIVNNCIIQFNIPEEFANGWNCTYLYYPQAIKWYWWFKERCEKYGDASTIEDCQETDDCCDCKEFLKLGGCSFFNALSSWINSLGGLYNTFATNSASVSIPITFTNSIDDIGEMSIFSSDWQEETDYHNTIGNSYGTVVNSLHQINDETLEEEYYYDTYMIKNGAYKGYTYNDYYENVPVFDAWTNYTDYYIEHNKNEFTPSNNSISSYTYSPLNNKIIYNSVQNDVTLSVPINRMEVTCIEGNMYEIINGKYTQLCYDSSLIASLKYKNNFKLQIFKDGDLEYAMFNGKRKIVETDKDGIEKIYFLKSSNCNDSGCNIYNGKYVVYNNTLYLVDNNKISIFDDEYTKIYPVLNGYFEYNGNIYYISGSTVVISNGYEFNDTDNSFIYTFRSLSDDDLYLLGINDMLINDNSVTIKYKYVETRCDIISGYTDSKLDLVRRKEITTDDLGNELPGYLQSLVYIGNGENQSNYNTPYDECTLDILYKVGDVSNLKPLVDTEIFGENKYHGNIITSIKFYYLDKHGNEVPGLIMYSNTDDCSYRIELLRDRYESMSENPDIINTMYCEITYYIGATIKKIGKTYSLDTDFHTGVKYIDKVRVTKQVGNYFMDENNSFTFKYYLLEPDNGSVDLSDFNDSVIWDTSTKFEFKPLIYKNGNNISDMTPDEFKEDKGWEHNNGMMVAPLIRTEFNLASSYPQIVDADIYIDRGISAAYEKHLKLQEIRTMQSLENYQNGWFKINNF